MRSSTGLFSNIKCDSGLLEVLVSFSGSSEGSGRFSRSYGLTLFVGMRSSVALLSCGGCRRGVWS